VATNLLVLMPNSGVEWAEKQQSGVAVEKRVAKVQRVRGGQWQTAASRKGTRMLSAPLTAMVG
jgi:hypothetical protein